MSDIDDARATFVATLDSRAEGSAGDIFDRGLEMAKAGEPRDAIRAYLTSAIRPGDAAERGDAGACADSCSSQCSSYPDGPPWYACYAGCFAGCMSG